MNVVDKNLIENLVDFSCVVTLFNEENNIEPLVGNLVNQFRQTFAEKTFEIVLVINGSLDSTPEKARALKAKCPEISLVFLKENQGYGGGIIAGLNQASGRFIGFTDGDEQITSTDVGNVFARALEGQFDLVKAKRVSREDGIQRTIISGIYNQLFRIMFPVRASDINAKPKVFKREALKHLNLQAKDWFLDAEVMIQAGRCGFTILEIPIVFHKRRHGTSNVRLGTLIEFLSNMWKYKGCQKSR